MPAKLMTAAGGGITLDAASTATDKTITVPADNGTLVYANSSGNVGIGTTSPTAKLSIEKSSDAASPSRTPADYSIRLTAAATNTYNGGICVSESTYVNAAITPIDTGSGGAQGWAFITGDNTSIAERARIDSSGNFLNNCTGITGDAPNAAGGRYTETNGNCKVRVTSNGNPAFQFYSPSGGTGSPVGSILVNSSSTSYTTSSDYRLKNSITPMTGALARVAALKPCTYKWNADGSDGEGFIAHELQAVVPDCVSGEKDAVKEDGTPVYQGIDTSFLVATLTAAIQELKAVVDAQAARIEALENK